MTPKWIGIPKARDLAAATLAQPPRHEHSARLLAPPGELVWTGVAPLEYCPPINRTQHEKPWASARRKLGLYQMLLAQHYGRPRAEPLPGRPVVHCTRFSSIEPDTGQAWEKAALDAITPPWQRGSRRHLGLCFLADDRPSCVLMQSWWEYVRPGHGFVLVRVYRGEAV